MAISALLEELDSTLGTVERRPASILLLARRYGAVAKDHPVTFVVVAEQARGEVVAAAVPLAAFGADLQLHCVVPV
jgi:hypothetical protein